MPKRKRRNSEKSTTSTTTQHEVTTPLRRSQRLLHLKPRDLNTDNSKPTKNQRNCKQKPSKELRKFDEKSLICGIPAHGSRRSSSLSGNVERVSSLRRSSRLSLLGNTNSVVAKSDDEESKKRPSNRVMNKSADKKGALSNKVKGKVDVGVGSFDEIVKKSERRIQSRVNFELVIGLKAPERRDEFGRKRENRVTRKRKRVEEDLDGSLKGWTREQEMALQRAYFSAKPTPNFWKKVSKLVPGKSAQDCFDKVQSDHLTPPQPLPRSRAKRINSSPLGCFSLSAGKVLSSSELKEKKLSRHKQKSHIAQKIARQLLQKHNRMDQNYEADLFSILEPNVNTSSLDSKLNDIVLTPKHLQEKQGVLQKCHERSSSGQKRPLSRFRSSSGTHLVSPPVLKQVKNRALHEKYIDQLNCREAKRKAAFARVGKENSRQINIQKIDVVRTAKNALVSDARDAINKLQHLQFIAKTSSDSDDDVVDMDDDEGDGLTSCFKQ